jgi:hypothetical protein
LSKIALAGAVSGTATFTIESPATSTNRTITIPDATTTLVGTDATQTLTNKTLTTPNIDSAQFATVSGTAPLYACRAWVNFDGTGVVAIRASGNVSSITDNGTGDYTVNFTTAMPDANYSINGNVQGNIGTNNPPTVSINSSNASNWTNQAPTTSAFRFVTAQGATSFDSVYVNVAIFR